MPLLGKPCALSQSGLTKLALMGLLEDFVVAGLHDVGEKARVVDGVYRVALEEGLKRVL
jgi:hypothetical protein